jgi:hypothetical protein
VCTHITWYCGGSFAVYSERCQVCHHYYECCRLKPWSLKAEQTLHGIYDPNTYIKASRIHLLHVYGMWIGNIVKEETVNHMIFCLHFLPLSLSLSHTHTFLSRTKHDEQEQGSWRQGNETNLMHRHAHNCLWAISSFAWTSQAQNILKHNHLEHEQSWAQPVRFLKSSNGLRISFQVNNLTVFFNWWWYTFIGSFSFQEALYLWGDDVGTGICASNHFL